MDIDSVANLGLFRGLPLDQLQLIAQFDQYVASYLPGERIIQEGEIGRELYVIFSGVVYVTKTDQGDEKIIATLCAGDTFGEMSFLTKRKRSTSVVAADDVRVLKVDDALLEVFGLEISDWIKSQIIEILVTRLEKMNEALVALSRLVPPRT